MTNIFNFYKLHWDFLLFRNLFVNQCNFNKTSLGVDKSRSKKLQRRGEIIK